MLAGAAVLLVLIALALIVPLVRPRRRPADPERGDSLADALALVAASRSRSPSDRRRALGLLARALRTRGAAEEGRAAADLAWSEPDPVAAADGSARRAHRAHAMRARLPLADAAALRPAWRRTRVLRWTLAVALVALVIATAALRRAPRPGRRASCQGIQRHRRARPLGEHLVGHVQPHRRDARRARGDERALRARGVLRRGVPGAATGHAELGAAPVCALLQGARAGHSRTGPRVPGEPLDELVQCRHAHLGGSRARASTSSGAIASSVLASS